MRMALIKNESPPTVLTLEKKLVDLVMLKEMFAIFCLIDIFTSYKKKQT